MKGKERHYNRGKKQRGFAFTRFHACGFTLIELSIVIFIILMMTSAAVPWMKSFAETTRLRSASRGIRSLMSFAQSCAVTQRTEYVVLFDANENEYWLSLLELLDSESGSTVIDSSRESLTESLDYVTEMNASELAEDEDGELQGSLSRTGGILGIPKEIAGGIQILQITSPRTSSEISDVDYVTFFPDGTAEDFEIYLQNKSGRTFLLTVAQATGRIAIGELSALEVEELGLEIIEDQ